MQPPTSSQLAQELQCDPERHAAGAASSKLPGRASAPHDLAVGVQARKASSVGARQLVARRHLWPLAAQHQVRDLRCRWGPAAARSTACEGPMHYQWVLRASASALPAQHSTRAELAWGRPLPTLALWPHREALHTRPGEAPREDLQEGKGGGGPGLVRVGGGDAQLVLQYCSTGRMHGDGQPPEQQQPTAALTSKSTIPKE